MRSFTKLTIFALLLAVLPTAHASVHKAADPKAMEFLKLVSSSRAQQTSSRKLLGGMDCFDHFGSDNASPYVGKCSGLLVDDESHWCDLDAVDCNASNDWCGAESQAAYDIAEAYITAILPEGSMRVCVADSDIDCCAPNGGAIAGTVIGCFVGLALIITAFAWCCKCCCFRPKQVVIVQQAAP